MSFLTKLRKNDKVKKWGQKKTNWKNDPTATNIYHHYEFNVYTEFEQNRPKNSSVWDCTIYIQVIAVFYNTNYITVFSVLAYDCRILVFLYFIHVKLTNKSCNVVLDILMYLKTDTKFNTFIKYAPQLKH